MRRRAMTIIEILVVIVIMLIVTLLSVPYYRRSTERTIARNARYNLSIVHNLQKRYKLDNGAYFLCPPPCTAATLNGGLNTAIDDRYFSYDIQGTSSGYTATATRNSDGGPCGGQKMTANEQSSTVLSGCSYW